MRVLIACEESQVVCKAFRERGHEAYSNDLLDCSGGVPEWHLKIDCFTAVWSREWDLIIMHPPCTALAVSGNAHYADSIQRKQASIWTAELWKLATNLCNKVCMENPVGVLNSIFKWLPEPHYIQPYQFGHDASKKTGLWLDGLAKLKGTKYIEPRMVEGKPRWANQTDSGQNNKGPSATRAKERSVTYEGIARAMAEQWG